MTERQISLVNAAAERIALEADENAALFFGRLFTIAPYLRPQFGRDLRSEGRALVARLIALAASLDRFELAAAELAALAEQNARTGFTEAHYDIAASALLWTLERSLGSLYTEEMNNAWVAFAVRVTVVMKEAAHARRTAGRLPLERAL